MAANADLESTYPNIARWVETHGWIEIGESEGSASFIRALDEGGLVWEGKREYKSLDHALRALERALQVWMEGNG